MIFLSLFAAVVGFPAYPTCHPATAAWDYAQLQRNGASDEVAMDRDWETKFSCG